MNYDFGEPVDVITPVNTTDQYGDTTSVTKTTTYQGCAIAPRTRAGNTGESTDPRVPGVISGLTVYLPAGALVRANSRMRVRGLLYQVEGEPGYWRSPLTGWAAGVEVAVSRWEQQ